MIITVKKGVILDEKADAIILGQFVDAKYAHELVETVAKEDGFKPALGATLSVRTVGTLPAKRVIVVGLGDKKKFTDDSARLAAAAALNAAKSVGAKKIACELFGSAKAMAEGATLANYEYGRYKSETKKKSPVSFDFVTDDGRVLRVAKDDVALGTLYANATVFARDLVNTPALHMHPASLVECAKELAKGKGSIRVKVYDQAALEKMGAGGLLSIAQGSEFPPYLVHMTYKPKAQKKNAKRVALVGKAVTFDSGGLSLKPANSMETMKCDMAGAAAVLGAFSVIAELAPSAEVHGIFGAVENMPSGKAIRPGDVVTVLNGKTIEIKNTDAEGRVTLADTLTYATRQKPDAIIDLATLTGACVVALGEEITGLMSNNDALANKVSSAAKDAGEKMWRMPLPEEYRELIKTDIADYKNDAPRWGGSLTAGLLLEEFVAGLPWVHLDIAGPAFNERPVNAFEKKGATGHGTRTLLEYLRNL